MLEVGCGTGRLAAALAERAYAKVWAVDASPEMLAVAREAQAVFAETVVPRDFDLVEIPLPERGSPQLVKGGAAHRREPEPVSSAPQ